MNAVSPSQEYQSIRRALMCGKSGCACAKGPNVHCPAHDDAHPSLTLSIVRNRVLWNCKSRCAQAEVTEALKARGLLETPLAVPASARKNGDHRSAGMLVKEWTIRREDGTPVAVHGRFELQGEKSFKWRLPDGTYAEGLRDAGLRMADIPLYATEALAGYDRAQPLFVVEGEKATDGSRAAGLQAVGLVGGANQQDFGAALDALKGWHVATWADNDPQGRALMAKVGALLEDRALSVRPVEVQTKSKGDDAYDYFVRDGGDAGAVLAGLPPTEPTVDHLGFDSWRIRVPTGAGLVEVTLAEMQGTAFALQAEIEIRLGGRRDPFTQRVNLLSGSLRSTLRRELEVAYGKEYGWSSVLNVAFALARNSYRERDRAVNLAEIDVTMGDLLLIDPLITRDAPTILFADGSSAKTYLAGAIAIGCAAGIEVAGFRCPKLPVLYVDWESSAQTMASRLLRLALALDLWSVPADIHYWPAGGIPLVQQADAIRVKVKRHGIGLVIFDSVAPACGGEPEKAEHALAFFRALATLGTSNLLIGHIGKNGDTQYPFGSIFWHNEARRTWHLERVQEEDTDELDLGLYCKKVNDGRKPKPIALHVSFTDPDGPVRLTRRDMAEVDELQRKRPLKDRIKDALKSRSMTPSEVAAVIQADRDSVASTLRNDRNLFVCIDPGLAGGRGNEARWAMKARNWQ